MKFNLPFTLPTFDKNTTFLIAALVILALVAIYYGTSTMSGFEDAPGKKFCMVYADWCPHCQSVKPQMQEFSDDVAAGKQLKGKGVSVHLVNGDPPSGTAPDPLIQQLPEVKGFPSFFLLDAKSGAATPYEGPREVSAMIDWITKTA